jgi:hypothetical protein
VGPDVALVEAAVIEADPEKAEERRLATAMRRFVHLGASDHRGFKTLYARLAAGDATKLYAMCDRIAQILRAGGDDDPMDVLRSKALGWLGTPLLAAALLQDAETRARAEQEPAAPQPSPRR